MRPEDFLHFGRQVLQHVFLRVFAPLDRQSCLSGKFGCIHSTSEFQFWYIRIGERKHSIRASPTGSSCRCRMASAKLSTRPAWTTKAAPPSFAPSSRTSWRVGSGRKPDDLFHSRPTAPDQSERPTSSIGLSGSKTRKNPRLALTETECCQLSTVFLGLDHQFRQRPATTVRNIGLSEGRRSASCYSTWDDAEAGHAAMIRRLQR